MKLATVNQEKYVWQKLLGMRILAIAFGIFTLPMLACGGINAITYQIDESTKQAVAAIDRAIHSLNNNVDSFENTLRQLEEDIVSSGQSTIRNEVSNTLNRAVAAAHSGFKCDVDFIRNRVQEDLMRLKASLLRQNVPPLKPAICDVIPVAGLDISTVLSGRQNTVEFHGYNFDISNQPRVILVDGNDRYDVSNYLHRPSHYLMVLNIGQNGVNISMESNALELVWQGQPLSSIPITRPNLPTCAVKEIPIPPPNTVDLPINERLRGDREFDGNGPQMKATVKLEHNGRALYAFVYGWARETKKDWSEGEGRQRVQLHDTGGEYQIISVIGSDTSSAEYMTLGKETGQVYPGQGPVHLFEFKGDRKGHDLEVFTAVRVYFNEIRLQVQEINNCVIR